MLRNSGKPELRCNPSSSQKVLAKKDGPAGDACGEMNQISWKTLQRLIADY
jgi:hypothetical protein